MGHNDAGIDKDMETLANRLRAGLLEGGDDLLSQGTHPAEWIRQQNEDGSWPDVDYDDRSRTKWIPGTHTSRLEQLARAFRTDGVYFLMQRGDEYHGTQPLLDYRRLPGLTFIDTDAPFPYGRDVKQFGNTAFVGGVSDGLVGVAAMDYAKDVVRAHKAYFFLEDGWVCLGAGISAASDCHAITSLNQCLLKSDVAFLQNGTVRPLEGHHIEADDLQGVHHDGVGYYFLELQPTVVTAGSQSGSWRDVEENALSDEVITKDVFSLWVDHGSRAVDAQYAYRIMPGVDRDAFATAAEDRPVHVLSNSPNLQALSVPDRRLVQCVFYAAGVLEIPGGQSIRVDRPCMVMLRSNGDLVHFSIADPTQALQQVQVRLEGRYAGGGSYTGAENSTVMTVDLPRDEFAGKSVQVVLRPVS